MHFGGRREVSLRGASSREVSRSALLNKVAEERAARSKARKAATSAALIQRVWRGRKAACCARQLIQSEWDTWHAARMAAAGGQAPAPLTADEVSQKLLAPVLFLLWDARKREGGEMQRLQSVMVWLLKSLDSAETATNFCSLAIGTQSQRATWQHQAHQMVSLCSALLSLSTSSSSSSSSSNPEAPSLLLTVLAMRVHVSLCDTTTWRFLRSPAVASTTPPGNALAAAAEAQVLSLLAGTASGATGIYPALRMHLLTNYAAPPVDGWRERKGKGGVGGGVGAGGGGGQAAQQLFLLTAAAVTVALRPIIVFSGKRDGQEVAGKLPSVWASLAADQFAATFSPSLC
ncbi:hypothetical protein CLOM_g13841 [Closterium sp. NIES-68]|nr:hypothetical protein CLOM_g13841 [Closterium sp. NIES-68]